MRNHRGCLARRLAERRANGGNLRVKAWAEDRIASDVDFEYLEFPTDGVKSTIAISFSPGGQTFATTHGDHTVKITNFLQGKVVQTLYGHPRTPWTVKFHPLHPNILASGCLGYEVRIWDARTGGCLYSTTLSDPIISLSFHPSGDLLAIASGRLVHIWDYKNKSSPYVEWAHRHTLRGVCFTPDGKGAIVGAANASIMAQVSSERKGITCRLLMFRFEKDAVKFENCTAFHTGRVLLHRTLLYNDGGFDVSNDNRWLCAVAQLRTVADGTAQVPAVSAKGDDHAGHVHDNIGITGQCVDVTGGHEVGSSLSKTCPKSVIHRCGRHYADEEQEYSASKMSRINIDVEHHQEGAVPSSMTLRRDERPSRGLLADQIEVHGDGGPDNNAHLLVSTPAEGVDDAVNQEIKASMREGGAGTKGDGTPQKAVPVDSIRHENQGSQSPAEFIDIGKTRVKPWPRRGFLTALSCHQSLLDRHHSNVRESNTKESREARLADNAIERGSDELKYSPTPSTPSPRIKLKRKHSVPGWTGVRHRRWCRPLGSEQALRMTNAALCMALDNEASAGPNDERHTHKSTSQSQSPLCTRTTALSARSSSEIAAPTSTSQDPETDRTCAPAQSSSGQEKPLPLLHLPTSATHECDSRTIAGEAETRSFFLRLPSISNGHTETVGGASIEDSLPSSRVGTKQVSSRGKYRNRVAAESSGSSDPATQDTNKVVGETRRPGPGTYVPHMVLVSLTSEGTGQGGTRIIRAAEMDSRDAIQVTSLKFSPSARYILRGAGVRDPRAHMEFDTASRPDRRASRAFTTILRASDLLPSNTMPAADDDVNIACFHPEPGMGCVYGTKQGRVCLVRMLLP